MKKIRVLHVIKTLDLGGAEVNLLNLLSAYDKGRFEMHVAYSAGGSLESRFLEKGAVLFRFAQKRHKLKSIVSLLIIWRLIKYMLEHRIDIVHTHTFNAHIWAGVAAKFTGRKIVEHVHDFRYVEPEERLIRKAPGYQFRYVRYLKNFSDRVVVMTRQNFNFLVERKLYPASKIRLFYNGIYISNGLSSSQPERNSLRKSLGIPEWAKVIFTPARLAPEKNLELIFEIAPNVFKSVPNAIFIIAGEGPLFSRLKELSAGMKGRVRLIGFSEEITNLLLIADIFFLPSFLELNSIAVLEAMDKKLPVVLSKGVGCNDEFIENGKNGILLDPFKKEGWSGAIIRLLKDEKTKKQIGESGYNTLCKNFDIRNSVRRLEDLYVELAD